MARKTVEIGSFLKERGDRFKPEEANTLDLKRIKKIDFQGKIHVIDHNPTKTNMILVKKGDLVISGINVEKGALAVYEEDEDALATIHYSSYEYDKNQVDIEYLKWFLKSRTFQNILKEQAGGGIKTELKPKKFLPLKIKLPKLDEQIDIARKINNVAAEIDDLSETNNNNQTLLIQLRQAILQEAVQGKLVLQNPTDEPASELLKRIKAEKEKLIAEGKIRKQKPLVDFQGLGELKGQLPDHWTWVRLTDIADIVRGGSPRPAGDLSFYDGEIPFLKVADVSRVKGKMIEGFSFTIKEAGLKKTRFINKRTVLLTNSGATLGIPAICDFDATFNDGIAAFVELSEFVFDEYLHLYLKSLSKWFIDIASRGQGQPNLNTDIIKATWFALPPLAEQHRIVAKVDELMHLCDELENRLNQSKKDSEMLMQAVLHEAFS